MTTDRASLTDEEFTEQLFLRQGTGGSADAEVVTLHEAVGSYRQQAAHWAERRSATLPSLAQAARRQERWAALPQWSLALVALVTLVGGIAHVTTSRVPDAAATEMAAQFPDEQSPATPAEIAADNHLLSSIDAELSYHRGSPVDGLGLQENGAHQTGTEPE